MEREQLLTRTFVELADNLVVEFDVVDVLTTLATRSVALLSVDAAAILLGDEQEAARHRRVRGSRFTARALRPAGKAGSCARVLPIRAYGRPLTTSWRHLVAGLGQSVAVNGSQTWTRCPCACAVR